MTLQNEQAAQEGLKGRGEHRQPHSREHRVRSAVLWAGGKQGTGASTASQRSFDILVRNKRPCEVLSKMKMLLKKETGTDRKDVLG